MYAIRSYYGMKGESRDSAMVIQGELREDEMLSDALERELKESLEITEFEMMDVVDDGGEMETDKGAMPLFTAVVKVEGFEPDEVIHDARIGWIRTDKKPKLVN